MDTLNQMPYPQKVSPEGNGGGLIAIILIIIILVVGGIYFFQTNKDRFVSPTSTTTPARETELDRIESEMNRIEKMDQDEASVIDAQFSATTTSN